ncbi:MAG: IS1595 family transposase [Bacteroidetes bacterium]|nr:IS1595 family transposase [Bacteroidota bacterium]MBL7103689.1 IS1595 family transposase [Bacteroidales bacterium]
MNIIEISQKFPTEFDAIKHFEKYRWGKTIICPFCNSKKISKRTKDNRWHCLSCNRTFSVTTKTQIHNTRLTLQKWLFAFGLISDAKKGISAKQLERNLGIHYETAWKMYHQIRDLMSIENEKIHLDHIVELDTKIVDEDMRKCQAEKKGTPTHIPELDDQKEYYTKKGFEFKEGKYKKPCKVGNQKRGEGASNKKIAGAVARDGDVIAHVVKNTSFKELRKIIDKYVNKDRKKTVLLTDEARSNLKFKEIINHIVINHKKMYSYRGLNTNTIESFWAIIERQIVGQHHHVDIKYLDKYVNEAVFKFNNRKHDDMFKSLIKLAMVDKN